MNREQNYKDSNTPSKDLPNSSSQNGKRQLLKVKGGYSSINTFQYLSFCPSEFIKCPVNLADSLKDSASKKFKAWKDFRLYVQYLDLKAQNPNVGTFQIIHSHRYYQRTAKALIGRGWAWREGRTVHLKAYQHVWRSMGIPRVSNNGFWKFKYWKIPVSVFSEKRKFKDRETGEVKGYLKEIENEIRQRITKRKLAQIRYALKAKGDGLARVNQVTFSAMSAASLFGFTSPASGSKVRSKYFSLIPQTPEEAKPFFNKSKGRYEEHTKQIAI